MEKVPRHVGIILDGNRRFAKKLMLKPWMGHEWGSKKVENLFSWCKEIDIKELTLYVLSIENFNREKKEFDFLMDVFRNGFKRMINDKRLEENKININFIGRLHMLPQDIQKIMEELMEKTNDYKDYRINFAMAYGGRTEIIDAVKKIAEQVKDGSLDVEKINEEVFADNIYLNSDPDLIIRTGGETRTSNFLMWQGAYSEWIFLDKMWPEFEKEDFVACIEEFSKRERRLGK